MAQVLIRLILAMVLIVSMGTACGTGTETGNPTNTPGVDGTDGGSEAPDSGAGSDCPLFTLDDKNQTGLADEETVLDELIERLCLEIFACDMSIGTLDCIAALNGTDGDLILDEFGILPEGVLDVEQVHNGLRQGILTTNQSIFEECTTAIQNIECSDVTNNVTEDNFTNVENIVPAACDTVFNQLPETIADSC